MLADITVSGCELSAPVCGVLTVYFALPLIILFITLFAFLMMTFFGIHLGVFAFFARWFRGAQREGFIDGLVAAGWKQTMPRQMHIYNSVICSIGRKARVHTVLQHGDYTLQIVSVAPRIGFMVFRRSYVMLSTKSTHPLPYMLCLQTDWRSSRLVPPKNTRAISVESNDFERKYALFVDQETPQFTFEVLEPVLIEKMQTVDDPFTLEISGTDKRVIMPLAAVQADGQLIPRASDLLIGVEKNVIAPKTQDKVYQHTFKAYRNISAWVWLAIVDALIFAALALQNHSELAWQMFGAILYHSSSVIALAVFISAIFSGPKRMLRNIKREKY